jgi:two-component system, cell cycle sensor histidine kinase and response regulator CckA
MAARLKTDEEAWLGQPPSPFVLPMLLGAALLSAALVLYAAGNGVLAAGFAASVIAIAGLMRWYRHL